MRELRTRTGLAVAAAAVLLTAGCTGSTEDDVSSSEEAVSSTPSSSSDGASASASPESTDAESKSAPVGVTLEKDRQTLTSALRVDLSRDFATLPLHKGTAQGETVWFVVTDVSDAAIAQKLGPQPRP